MDPSTDRRVVHGRIAQDTDQYYRDYRGRALISSWGFPETGRV